MKYLIIFPNGFKEKLSIPLDKKEEIIQSFPAGSIIIVID